MARYGSSSLGQPRWDMEFNPMSRIRYLSYPFERQDDIDDGSTEGMCGVQIHFARIVPEI